MHESLEGIAKSALGMHGTPKKIEKSLEGIQKSCEGMHESLEGIAESATVMCWTSKK